MIFKLALQLSQRENTHRIRLQQVGVVHNVGVPDDPHQVVGYKGQEEVLVDGHSGAIEAP